MAILLNRKYPSRLECLYYILKTTYNNFKKNPFIISNVKYNEELPDNILNNCDLLKTGLGRSYCPYLDNPLDSAKCYATQSQQQDSTKSKAASSVVRAWEALGLVKPINNKFQLSPRGIDLVNTNFESEKWFKIIQRSILSYGPIIGYLQDALEEGESFEFSKLFISYPLTEEPMELSTYSTKDSNTRTVSMLTSWCIQGGLITPLAVEGEGNQLPHLAYRNIINEKRLTTRKFTITSYAKNYIENVPYVDNPLSYKNLNKNVGSLREKNSANIRNRTQEFNSIILNRRFAILYVLNNINNSILFSNLIALFKRHCNVFFLPNSNIESVLQSELGICKLSGLILKYNMIDNDLCIKRCSNINNEIISFEAPEGIIQLAVDMVNMVG